MPAAKARWRLALGRSRSQRSRRRRTSPGRGWPRRAPSSRSPRRAPRRRRSGRPASGSAPSAGPGRRSAAARRPPSRRATGRRASGAARRGGAAGRAAPLPIRLTVVSWPATYSSTTNDAARPGVSRSPASSTSEQLRQQVVTEAAAALGDDVVEVAADGRWRRRSAATIVASSAVGSSAAVSVCDQSRISSSRSVGMPSRSEMTWNGTGKASSSTSSIEPRSAARSRMPSTSASIRGRSRSMADGVKASDTSRRSRVWSGGSRLRMFFAAVAGLPPLAQPLTAHAPDRVAAVVGVGLDVAGELVAAQRPGDVVVAGQHDEAERRHVHRFDVAQARVERVRVGPERRVERVERGVGRGQRVSLGRRS